MADAQSDNWILLGRGKSSEVFRIAPGKVIKIFHAAVSEEMIEREMRAAMLAASRAVPTAAPLERVVVGDLPALIYPEVAGKVLAVIFRKQPFAASALLTSMAILQHDIHAQTIEGLRRVRTVLATDIIHGPVPNVLRRAALDHLERLPDGSQLLHGDFHIDNILVSTDRLIVLDWAKAALGDPAADVVRSEMLMRFGEGPADPITSRWRDWAAWRLRKAYQQATGLTNERLALWRPVVALAWLRARPPIREHAFRHYLDQALRRAGLPRLSSH